MINEALSGEQAILSINYSSILIKHKRKRKKNRPKGRNPVQKLCNFVLSQRKEKKHGFMTLRNSKQRFQQRLMKHSFFPTPFDYKFYFFLPLSLSSHMNQTKSSSQHHAELSSVIVASFFLLQQKFDCVRR